MTEPGTGSPGRRAVLGAAAAAGAGAAAVLAASAGPAHATGRRGGSGHGGRGRGRGALPVPAVIAHRGASGYRPEHTLGSYQLALDMGADVIEQDLVPTKDGKLVCRHENEIGGTTDVADHPEFASRRTTKTVDGTEITGWFTEDFTLAELKTLRAVERIPDIRPHNTLYNGRWTVPSFEEVLVWAREQGRRRGRPVWLHAETKHPTYFRSAGVPLEEELARLLRKYGLHRRHSPVFLQSFEPTSMERMSRLVDTARVVLLWTPDDRPFDFQTTGDPRTVADLVTPAGLAEIAGYAQGIGPLLDLIIPRNQDGTLGAPTTLVADAHAAGLLLHPYTARNENRFLPAEYRRGTDPDGYGDVFGALRTWFDQGIDGIFTDNPDTALLAAADFRAATGS
ncbi:glycerophosphodiester phosphodiesterase [Streptomyces aidingensis]|uniref:glycerophosphodiester phosphodiesterase n=1 Tax=Streptomyces aidingensis TaxID=910347 RepID=UPI001FEC52B8|nr:glycerophosphodiester phosphodiesterase [Streptomyces aidingensis]